MLKLQRIACGCARHDCGGGLYGLTARQHKHAKHHHNNQSHNHSL